VLHKRRHVSNKNNKVTLALRLQCLTGYIETLEPGNPLRGAMIEERDKVRNLAASRWPLFWRLSAFHSGLL